MSGRRVVIAYGDPAYLRVLKDQVTQAGYLVTMATDNGRQAGQVVFSRQPDVVLLGHRLAGRDGIELARVFSEQWVAPAVFISDEAGCEDLGLACQAGIYGYLIRPVEQIQLVAAMEVAVAQFRAFVHMWEEDRNLKEALETRRVAEIAKGILMERLCLSEREAYQMLRKESMDHGLPMRLVAKRVIEEAR